MPEHIKQTSKQAKASYKKHGQRVPEKEQRQLQRGIELDRRAEECKERERRRKEAMKKRKEREEKENEIRSRMGVGLATQLAGFNHTQKQLKGAMESFLGLGKKKQSVGNDNAAAEASFAAAMKHDSLIDAGDDFWKSSPLDTSVHSQDDGDDGGETCAGLKSPAPAPPSPGKGPGNLVHHQPTRPGEASTIKQNVKVAEQQGARSPSNTIHGHQDLAREDTPGMKSSQSEMWDDMLDDATMLSALKGKTPTSQTAWQCSQVPTPTLHEPASPCQQKRYQSEPVHLPSRRSDRCEEKFPSFTQLVDEDPLAAIDFDCFDDLFPSNSQIQRELTPPKPTKSDKPTCPRGDLAAEGQRETELSSRAAQPFLVPASRSRPQQQSGQAHGAPPSHVKSKSDPQSFDTIKQPHGTSSISSLGPSKSSPHLSFITNISRSRLLPLTTSKNANMPKTPIYHDSMAPRCSPGIPNISRTLPKPTSSPDPKRPAFAPPCQKRKISQSASSLHPPVKRKLSTQCPGESRPPPNLPPRALTNATATKPWVRPAPKSMSSSTTTMPSRFTDFGLSTQILGDAIDDDLDLSP